MLPGRRNGPIVAVTKTAAMFFNCNALPELGGNATPIRCSADISD